MSPPGLLLLLQPVEPAPLFADFLFCSSLVSPYPGENGLRRKRNEKYWLSVGYVMLCYERGGESKNILYRPKRLKKCIQTRIKTKKNSENPTPYPFIYHFSRKRYPFHIPSISDEWCPFIPCLDRCIPFDCCKSEHCFFFLHRNQSDVVLFFFSFL